MVVPRRIQFLEPIEESHSSYSSTGGSKTDFTRSEHAFAVDEGDDSECTESEVQASTIERDDEDDPECSTRRELETSEIKVLADADDDESACSEDERETPEGEILKRVLCAPWNPRDVLKIFMEDYSLLSDELRIKQQNKEEANKKKTVTMTKSEIDLVKDAIQARMTNSSDSSKLSSLLKTLDNAKPEQNSANGTKETLRNLPAALASKVVTTEADRCKEIWTITIGH